MQLLSQWDKFLLCVVCRRSWTPSCLTTWSSSNRRRCVGTAQARHGRRSASCVTSLSPCAPWCPAANLSLGMYYWHLKAHLHQAKSERESDIAPDWVIESIMKSDKDQRKIVIAFAFGVIQRKAKRSFILNESEREREHFSLMLFATQCEHLIRFFMNLSGSNVALAFVLRVHLY